MKKDNQKNKGISMDNLGRLIIEDKRLLKIISGGKGENSLILHSNNDGNLNPDFLQTRCTHTNSWCV